MENMENMEKDISEQIAKSFKKNSWMAKMMFSSDISEIIIERNKYNFEIKIYTKDKSVNIPFYYKPNTRKRKRKNSISHIAHNKDSGYDSSNDEKDRNKIENEIIDKDKNFNKYINSISIDHDSQDDEDGPITYRNDFLNISKNDDDINFNVDNIAHRKTKFYESEIVEKDKKENININIDKYKNNNISLNLEHEAHRKNDLIDHKKTISFGSLEFNIEKNDNVTDNVLFGPREKNTKIIDKYIYIYNLFKNIISNLTILNDTLPPFHYKYSTLQTITSIILNTIIEVDNNLKLIFKINLTHRKNEFQLYIK